MKHQMKMFKFAQKINLFTVGGEILKEILFELKW